MIYPFDINLFISNLTLGALLICALYHLNLYYFNKSKLLKAYSIYLWSCVLFLIPAIFLINGKFEPKLIIPFIICSTTLRISFYAYFKFLFHSLNNTNLISTKIYYFAHNFWVVIPFHIIIYLTQFIFNIDLDYILKFENVLMFLFAAYFLFLTTIHLKLKIQGNKFYIYILLGGISMLFFNLFSILTRFNNNYFIGLSQLSYICIGFFSEIFFFSISLSIKMKYDSKIKFQALNELNNQQNILENEKAKATDILVNQELELKIERSSALNEQRISIGRKLHDDLTGSLLSLKYLVSDFKSEASKVNINERLHIIESEIDSIYEDTRFFSHQLSSNYSVEKNYTYDLKLYLEKLKSQFNSLSLLRINFEIDDFGLKAMSNDKSSYLYFCVKECFSNSLKHSNAKNIWIEIKFSDGLGMLHFKDDGKGFAKDSLSGMGVKNMKFYIEKLSGTYEINTKNDAFTEIKIWFKC